MRKVVGVIALGALLLTATGLFCGHGDLETELYQAGLKKTYRLLEPQRQKRGGTGFLIETPAGSQYLLTNRHVCLLHTQGRLIAEREGTQEVVRVLAVTDDADLCILTSPASSERGFKLALRADMYERVYILGHPHLNPISISTGHFNYADFAPINYCLSGGPRYAPRVPYDSENPLLPGCMRSVWSYFTDAYSQPGNSGSPVLNNDGEVVGVLYAGGDGVSLVVPLAEVQAFLEGR